MHHHSLTDFLPLENKVSLCPPSENTYSSSRSSDKSIFRKLSTICELSQSSKFTGKTCIWKHKYFVSFMQLFDTLLELLLRVKTIIYLQCLFFRLKLVICCDAQHGVVYETKVFNPISYTESYC